MPVDIIRISGAVLGEPIRRVAVHVFPRARFGNAARQTQATTESLLRVLVLVERPLRSAENGRKRPKRHERNAKAAAPFAREIPRLDLLEGPFLRIWAFFEATAAVGRERHATERIGARVARQDHAPDARPTT